MPMMGKSRWFRRRKQIPLSELSARKHSALRLRLQLFPGRAFPRLKTVALGLPILPTILPIFLLILTLAVGCSRPSDLPADERVNQAGQRKLPFEDNAAKGNSGSNSDDGNSREANPPTASNVDPRAAGGPPFQTPSSDPDLPPGTLATVRVEKQIFTDRTGVEGTFAGVVDEPVVMDGKIVWPPAPPVTGRIEAAPASDGGRGRGYIRLTLDTITIAGKTLPLRTSSLFVRGSAGEVSSPSQASQTPAPPTGTRLQKGRRLPFRLATTVPRDRQETVSTSQNHPANTE